MEYGKVIEESLRNTSLKRIRIKVDPAKVGTGFDFAKCEGYEGYVLEECMGRLRVLVLSPDMPICNIPEEFIEAIAEQQDIDVFEEYKAFIINNLIKDGKTINDPLLEQIKNVSDINSIEVLISQAGYSGDRLAKLYRDFITNEK
jgi:hypothetical protein